MADLTITAASVVISADARVNNSYVAGEAVTAGQVVYLKAADSRWWLSGTAGSAALAQVGGIALHGASAGQPLAVMEAGDITIGATIAAAVEYYVSNNVGGICPVADIGSADYLSIVGYGISTTVLRLMIKPTGIARA